MRRSVRPGHHRHIFVTAALAIIIASNFYYYYYSGQKTRYHEALREELLETAEGPEDARGSRSARKGTLAPAFLQSLQQSLILKVGLLRFVPDSCVIIL